MPEVCPRGGGMFKLRFDWYINLTLIRLYNKSSPQFICLNGTKCRLSKVIARFIWFFGLLVDPRGTRKAIFCRSATRTFLRICRVIIYRNEAMLLKPSLSWLAWAGTGGMSVTQLTRIIICSRHRPLLGGFYRAPKSCQVTSLAGKQVINFQMAVEICFPLGKTIIILPSDRVSVISFAGFGLFFSESWVISNSKITYLYFVAFHIWIFGWGNPHPPSKNLLKCPVLGSYRAIKRPFSSSIP